MIDIQERQNRARIDQERRADERFRARKQVRDSLQDEIRKKGISAIESPERISARMSLIHSRDGVGLERVLGRNDLLAVNYLDLGSKVSRAVCRIQVRDEVGRVIGFGTGFLVSPDLLLTNNHVLDRPENCRRSLADFNFEDDVDFIPKDTKTFPLEPDRFFRTNPDLDFTLVAVRPKAIDNTSLSGFGFVRLREESGKALLNECVSVIQHPDGATKQVTLRDNRVVDLPDVYVHYLTDTKPGSSGSPVFDDQWAVVALHHAGVKKKDAGGNVLSVDGARWDPAMGEDRIAWEANEGVRISSICTYLRNRSGEMSADERDLLGRVLAGDASPAGVPRARPMEAATGAREWYEGSAGYDPDFLGMNVPLPRLPDHLAGDVVPPAEEGVGELKYPHFSVVMSGSRKLAFFTAVNIAGDKLIDIKRKGDKWYFDPRLDRKYQSGPELYSDNDLDRGHLVRRLDPVWGDQAEEANEATFHFTNCSPQHKELNQRTWQNLEDYVLKNAGRHGLKVVVFTGPIFRSDDMLYRGKFQIPAEFWKVVVIVKDDGKPSATAYLQTQKNLIQDLEFAYGKYRTYQVPVSRIESLTSLDFGALRTYDPLSDIEGTVGRVIEVAGDIRL